MPTNNFTIDPLGQIVSALRGPSQTYQGPISLPLNVTDLNSLQTYVNGYGPPNLPSWVHDLNSLQAYTQGYGPQR
jgi:hypothetical protein